MNEELIDDEFNGRKRPFPTPSEPYEDFGDSRFIGPDLMCTCDDDPDFCEIHKEKICSCDEDPGFCPVHDTWE